MRPLQIAIIGLLVLLNSACKGTKETVEEKIDKPVKENMNTALPPGNQSLFWQIRGKDIEKPSYLYGTIHVISAEDYFLGENVKQKLVEADKLIMEIDLDEMDMNAIANAGLLPDNKTIKDYLSEEDYEFISTRLSDSIGLSRSQFEMAYARMKPIFIQQLVVYKFLGENPASYESNFNEIASMNDVDSYGLETFREQLDFLDQIPIEDQLQDMVDAIRDWNETKSQFEALVAAYKLQDLEVLNHLIEDEMESPKMRELLLNKRNTQWMPELSTWIDEGNAFIAVGAGHLEGEFGVINLLRRAGYEVWPYPAGPDVD
ncbi:MAG: TraB/GumN family protein [Chitinophagales bacterium]